MPAIPDRPSPDGDVRPFGTVADHADLLEWSRAYARRVVESTDLAVDLGRVDWDVSTRAKRRAAAVLHPRVDGATLGTEFDWRAVDGREQSGPPACTVRLTWEAAQSYDRSTWAETLRHELVHVEQFQRCGATGHGPAFEARAAELETTVRCQRFATPAYVLTCRDCETVVARRYRDCKLVRRHESYRSSCCGAPLGLTRTGHRDAESAASTSRS